MNVEHVALPVINFATLDQPETQRALDCACRSWGAFVLVGHPLDPPGGPGLLDRAREFFHQPAQVKQALSRTRDNPCGFFDSELTSNVRDLKEIYDYSPAELGEQSAPWPQALPAFRQAVTAHYEACVAVATRLLEAVCDNLGAPFEQVSACFAPDHTSFLRLNYYPLETPGENREPDDFGVNAHTDSGALTLLIQDANAGLEVYRDGQWYSLSGGAVIVNIGDIVQVWSNDRYVAPLHRVAASSNCERLSAPFFFNPSFDTVYQPFATTVDQQNPPVYRPIAWEEFRRLRAAGDYADYGEEVQIRQYRMEGVS